jgi:endonuclease-3 related protein
VAFNSAFETIIGAILARMYPEWSRQAVCALKERGLLDADALYKAGPQTIAPLIRSSRYYNQKAQRIITFVTWFLNACTGDIEQMKSLHVGSSGRNC